MKIPSHWLLASTVALGRIAFNLSVALFKVDYILLLAAFKILFVFLYLIFWVLPSHSLWPGYPIFPCLLSDAFEYIVSMVTLFLVGVSVWELGLS